MVIVVKMASSRLMSDSVISGFKEGQGRMSVLFAQVSCVVHNERLNNVEAGGPGEAGPCLAWPWVPAQNEGRCKKRRTPVTERICVGSISL